MHFTDTQSRQAGDHWPTLLTDTQISSFFFVLDGSKRCSQAVHGDLDVLVALNTPLPPSFPVQSPSPSYPLFRNHPCTQEHSSQSRSQWHAEGEKSGRCREERDEAEERFS